MNCISRHLLNIKKKLMSESSTLTENLLVNTSIYTFLDSHSWPITLDPIIIILKYGLYLWKEIF